jgi:hypothetical protein
MRLFLLIASFILLLMPANPTARHTRLAAQDDPPPVVAVWETDVPPEEGWTVGDVIPLRLRVIHDPTVEITLPTLPEQWGPFEVREQHTQAPITDDEGNKTTVIHEVQATLWTPGKHETPTTTVSYQDPEGQAHEIPAQPVSITIVSVLPEAPEEGELEKHDLKPQAVLPRPPIWPWVLAGVLGAVLLFFAGRWAWKKWRQRQRGSTEEDIEPVDDRPPEDIAYEELARIAALDLPAQHASRGWRAFKLHYTLVTDCIRGYIEGLYDIPAPDLTTWELMPRLRRAAINGEAITQLRALLEEADLVKFAKYQPSIQQAYAILDQAKHIVDITKPTRAIKEEEMGHG